MKSWPDAKSPWGKQLRFDDNEFEAMMDEMRARVGGPCFESGKGVNVDLVLLKAIGAEADYVDLPSGIMGRTIFGPDGSVTIEVSRALSDNAETDRTARRRLRTTLAHECGHVACHRTLFLRDTETLSLFAPSDMAGAKVKPPIMCRGEGSGNAGYNGEWWEFQANRCMAALLMPKTLFGAAARKRLGDGGFKSGDDCVAKGFGEAFVRELSDEFDVSQTATLFRLQALGFIAAGQQGRMRFAD